MINDVTIMGRLGQDPELKYTPAGNAVCNFSVATTKKWNDQKTGKLQEKTEWHRVVCWQKTAEFANEFGNKGDWVTLKGELQTRSWDDKDGIKRYTTEIVASRVIFPNIKDKPTEGEQKRMQEKKQDSMLDKNYDVKSDESFTADDIPF